MIWLVLLAGVVAADDPKTSTPPSLTTDQIAQVRALMQRTQAVQAEAKSALVAAQESLAREYARYELDTEKVTKLQAEVISQQQRLLENHHRLHVELRKIVGAERFQVLSKRIENALRDAPAAERSSSSSTPSPK